MDIRFSGKNLSVTKGMKEHFEGKLTKLEKYAPRIVEAHVILKKEKYLFEAEITLLAKNFRAFGEAKSKANIFAAIDQACLRVEKQLKKFRSKVKDHHRAEKTPPLQEVSGESTDDFLEQEFKKKSPRIMKDKAFAAKPMSEEEASLQLTLSPKSFLVFLNASTEKVNVIYKRPDGHHGLVEAIL